MEGSEGSGKVVRQIIEKIQRSFPRPKIVKGYLVADKKHETTL